ncbi:glycosyltransferase [Neobacillus bataviensis LMG 21833]|uniref:Glycosyltransferase n=1 Tax=Neobacillus bataviensis LMG 21833 TaxID=1117379 RepID=K6D1V0_9BACI|nr:glycosyltransferase family 4 protein [Neobacillus bataviensis]EKN66472.1 glycosyltransferase [Neobacillus bataviensis LMG 21833]
MSKVKMVFAGHDLKFAQLIIDYLEKTNRFDIRLDQWAGHHVHDEKSSKEYLDWADIIVCEWGLGNAVWYSAHKRPHQKLIVRMHRQELDTAYPQQFTMENMDALIAISPYVYEEFYRVFKLPREKTHMIYNVLDAKKLDKPKTAESNFHLGIIGIAPKMKRLDVALDVLEALWAKDKRYKLFVKGKLPQEYPWLWKKDEERDYYEEQFHRIEQAPWKNAVAFDGFGEVDEWLQKIGFVLSTSDFESFHLAPSEGMASGAIPLILKWDGSDTIYNQEILLENTNAIVNRVLEFNEMGAKQKEEVRQKAKSFVNQRFDIEKIGKEWVDLIEELLSK